MIYLEKGVAKFRVKNTAGSLIWAEGPVLQVGSWTHLVGTFDGTSVRLYVNGALVGSTAASGPLNGGAGQSFIGRLGQNLYPFQGTLDEVAVLPTALSAPQELPGELRAWSARPGCAAAAARRWAGGVLAAG